MTFNRILESRKISAYRLSKESGVPYMTINDLINKKTSLAKCNSETVYKIAKSLDVSVEELVEPYLKNRPPFDLFKSNVCHRLKELGDIAFLIDLLDNDEITYYYNLEWFPECLYLLAMLDYISGENNVALCSDYNNLRKLKLPSVVYPSSVIVQDIVSNSNKARKDAWENSIPEFKQFNIVENEVRNIV